MPNSETRAAATSSCVESGFDAHSTTSAPPAFSVRIRFAVSVVTWRQAETRYPASGCSRSKRSRIVVSTGICRSAHMMRRRPSGASDRSFTSCFAVVAIRVSLSFLLVDVAGTPFAGRVGSGREQPFVLPLLPFDPGEGVVGGAEPAVDGPQEIGLAAQTPREGDVRQIQAEGASQLAQRAQAVELGEPVEPVAARGARGHDQAVFFEVAEHPRRPSGRGRGSTDRQQLPHTDNLTRSLRRFGGRYGADVPSRP